MKTTRRTIPLMGATLLIVLGSACGRQRPATAIADIRDSGGTRLGTARFEPLAEDRVRVVVEVNGAPPGSHGIHIHEVGRCDPPDFTSAGGHFNPGGQAHHGPEGAGHAGDLPNIFIKPDGHGRLEASVQGITLEGQGHHSLFHLNGTSIVMHQNADDRSTDSAGGAGERIACGVIVAAN